ncbi:MAG TPA: proteasome accessory factor PafA2, partial [Actinobacteria bacterium]|nr:proteasome accessory factor PafA2 [Actinomycetota bacterium]
IIGDANMSETATFLKVGTTALLIKLIEDELLPDLSVDNPVSALHEVSWDLSCR